jgi:hypothetical protein
VMHPVWFTLYASISAFGLYTCVYALRKTFAVATFEGQFIAGISYKIWLITFQVAGYALSKFLGIKIISELKPGHRAAGVLVTSLIAAASWLLFAAVPKPYNIIFLLINGLVLGLVWGMIFSYLEGRKMTEILGIALSISFIFSSGLCRSAGSWLMSSFRVSEFWMPFLTCCLFFPPLLFFLFLLNQLPEPDQTDIALRTKRQPMDQKQRKLFFFNFWPGIVLFVIIYMVLTTFRDFRDNFSAEFWAEAGGGADPSIYTSTEVVVSLVVMLILGGIIFIRNNHAALMVNHLAIFSGFVLIGLANYFFKTGIIQAKGWMILVGTGLYLGYIPFNSILIDRLLATFRYIGTVGFLMYLLDSCGYLGSVAVLYLKEFLNIQLSWMDFFMEGSNYVALTGIFLILVSMYYFHRKYKASVINPQIIKN